MDSKLDEDDVKEKTRRWSVFRFLEELKVELKKVSWTSKQELKAATKAVVISTFAFGIGIYLVDLAVKGALFAIGLLFRWCFG